MHIRNSMAYQFFSSSRESASRTGLHPSGELALACRKAAVERRRLHLAMEQRPPAVHKFQRIKRRRLQGGKCRDQGRAPVAERHELTSGGPERPPSDPGLEAPRDPPRPPSSSSPAHRMPPRQHTALPAGGRDPPPQRSAAAPGPRGGHGPAGCDSKRRS